MCDDTKYPFVSSENLQTELTLFLAVAMPGFPTTFPQPHHLHAGDVVSALPHSETRHCLPFSKTQLTWDFVLQKTSLKESCYDMSYRPLEIFVLSMIYLRPLEYCLTCSKAQLNKCKVYGNIRQLQHRTVGNPTPQIHHHSSTLHWIPRARSFLPLRKTPSLLCPSLSGEIKPANPIIILQTCRCDHRKHSHLHRSVEQSDFFYSKSGILK